MRVSEDDFRKPTMIAVYQTVPMTRGEKSPNHMITHVKRWEMAEQILKLHEQWTEEIDLMAPQRKLGAHGWNSKAIQHPGLAPVVDVPNK